MTDARDEIARLGGTAKHAADVSRRRDKTGIPPQGIPRPTSRPGCLLCGVRKEATQLWLRWFIAENHADPALLRSLGESAGFCPVHNRRLFAEAGPHVMRLPLVYAIRGAASRAERLTGVARQRRWRSRRPAAPCPLCRVIAERERAAAADVAAMLDQPEAAAALADCGGLCRGHLGRLLSRLSVTQATVAADIVNWQLAVLPAGAPETLLVLAGQDDDALARVPFIEAHARRIREEPHAVRRSAELSPASRLIADLAAGSCPACRAASREEVRYLLWLGEDTAEHGPVETVPRLCPRHLYDAWHLHAAGTASRNASWLASAVSAGSHAHAALDVADDRSCRACLAGLDGGQRQLGLLRACLLDTRVLRAVGEAHGLCLRHAAVMAADHDAGPVLSRLVTQLREVQWELDEDAAKRAWDRRHEPKGHEQDAWRRAPALVDGAVYLGTDWPAIVTATG